jgi:hypothetical protein
MILSNSSKGVLLPSAENGCKVFTHEEPLPDGRILLRLLLRVLLYE